MALEPGVKVRVINPNHWLFDKTGHIVKATLDAHIKKQMAGAAPKASAGVPVDFGRSLHGWYETPLQGERRVTTHICDGALKHPHGYYMLERDLKIVDIAGGVSL
jgi:hypothetical protein